MMSPTHQIVFATAIALLGASCAHSQSLKKAKRQNETPVRLVTCPGPLPEISDCLHSKITPLTKQVWMIEGGSACFETLAIECTVEENSKQAILGNTSRPAPDKSIIPKK